jgi:hypothetical protein
VDDDCAFLFLIFVVARQLNFFFFGFLFLFTLLLLLLLVHLFSLLCFVLFFNIQFSIGRQFACCRYRDTQISGSWGNGTSYISRRFLCVLKIMLKVVVKQ